MVITDYENTSRMEGPDFNQLTSAFLSNLKALMRLNKNEYINIDGIELKIVAKTSPAIKKIGLDDSFWISVALEEF